MSVNPDSELPRKPGEPPTVDIIIPVFNEEKILPKTIQALTRFLEDNLPNPWQVTIADNASTDR
ncbi:MAG: glycosyltransferase, partial [Dehalococcoidia bacterium]|nr:glycosyltransferase [Dehalococcoidia bacterium]